MTIAPDTNVLIRAIVADDADQAIVAQRALDEASEVVISTPALCETVWALMKVYRWGSADVLATIQQLIEGANVSVDREAVDFGLRVMGKGADFADGMIAYDGARSGGIYVTFDRPVARN
ncbi:MAG TPA: VapC toxin family PIN domain ribonuclease, partial [Parvularcula sp.]|nr:VapC toxin family PIN domain ribonuclease [Parvularcula sp.]